MRSGTEQHPGVKDMAFRRLQILSIAALGLTLAACGGGDDEPDEPPLMPKTLELRGACVKGLVRNADVQLFEYSSSSFASPSLLAGGVTDANGRYALSVLSPTNYKGGAVLLRFKGKASGTEARCDVDLPNTADDCGVGVAFGAFYPVNESFVLDTSFPALKDSGDSITTLNASVFTNLVTDRAAALLSGAATTADAIDDALSQVNQLAGGLDVAVTAPVDFSDAAAVAAASPESVAYGALNSGLLRLASIVAPGVGAAANTNAAIDGLNGLFAPAASIRDADLQAIADAGRAQLAVVGKTDAAGVFATIDAFIAQPGDTVTYIPRDRVDEDAVAAAKRFATDLRTVFQTYRTALDPEDNGFSAQLNMAEAISGEATETVLQDVTPVIECTAVLVAKELDDGHANDTIPEDCVQLGADQFQVGNTSIVRSRSGGATRFDLLGDVGSSSLSLTLSYPSDGENAVGATLVASIGGTMQTTAATGVELILTGGALDVTAHDASLPIANDDTLGNIDSIRLRLDGVMIRQKGVANPLTAAGGFDGTVLRCSRADCAVADASAAGFFLDLFRFNGEIADTQGNLLRGRFELDVRNPRNFNPDGGLAGYSADNFIDGTATLTLDADLPGRPVAQVVLTVDSTGYDERSGQPIGTVTLTLIEDGQMTVRGQSRSTASLPGFDQTVEFTNSDGIVLSLRDIGDGDDDVIGTLTLDGETAATVSQRAGALLIRYADGSFETLFN